MNRKIVYGLVAIGLVIGTFFLLNALYHSLNRIELEKQQFEEVKIQGKCFFSKKVIVIRLENLVLGRDYVCVLAIARLNYTDLSGIADCQYYSFASSIDYYEESYDFSHYSSPPRVFVVELYVRYNKDLLFINQYRRYL